MQLKTKVIGAIGIAALVAAGGSAYTAGIAVDPAVANTVVGSTGSVSVSGATVTNIAYTLDATEAHVLTAALTVNETLGSAAHVSYKIGSPLAAGTGTCAYTSTHVATCTFGTTEVATSATTPTPLNFIFT